MAWSLLLALLCAGGPARAHDLPYALVSLDLRTAGEARVEVRCHVPALVMGLPQGHLPEGAVPGFIALSPQALEGRMAQAAQRFAREASVRVDGQLLPPALVRMPPAQTLQAEARVPRSDPRPSTPLSFTVPIGADAARIDIALPAGLGPSVAVVTHADGRVSTLPLGDGERTPPLRIAGPHALADGARALIGFIGHGFRHILPLGLDHVLFIVALAVGAPRLWALVKLATLFTAAHSLTLALAALGVVRAPPELVEPAIAASIAVAALLNLAAPGAIAPWRYGMIFALGLLHGLGFAGALAELGLPQGQLVPALVGFNLGVELGQLAVIAAVLAAVGWAAGRAWYRPRIMAPASIAVACLAIYWTVERLLLQA